MLALVASYDDGMMEDFRDTKQEIFRLREEGNLDEAKRLQNELYEKVMRCCCLTNGGVIRFIDAKSSDARL